MTVNFTELSDEQVDSLLAGKRQTSEFREVLDAFLASDSRGIDISNSFPERKVYNVGQSFKRLIGKHSEYSGIQVVLNGDTLALVKR